MGNNQSLQHLSNHTEKIVMLVRSIQKNLREYIFEKSKKYGLTGPQMLLIFNLYKNSGINLIDLSKMMELSESTVGLFFYYSQKLFNASRSFILKVDK